MNAASSAPPGRSYACLLIPVNWHLRGKTLTGEILFCLEDAGRLGACSALFPTNVQKELLHLFRVLCVFLLRVLTRWWPLCRM